MKKRILVTGCAGVRLTLSCDRLPYSGESALGESYSYSPDLRGAAAMVIAALSAEGQSLVVDSGHIMRGYEHFDQRLRYLGADIFLEL